MQAVFFLHAHFVVASRYELFHYLEPLRVVKKRTENTNDRKGRGWDGKGDGERETGEFKGRMRSRGLGWSARVNGLLESSRIQNGGRGRADKAILWGVQYNNNTVLAAGIGLVRS